MRTSARVAVATFLTFLMTLGLVFTGGIAQAFTWPWEDKPATTTTVQGSVRCDDVTTFFGGGPADLTLTFNGQTTVLAFPFKPTPGATYKPPSFAAYRVDVPIPAEQDSVELSYTLRCYDNDGVVQAPREGAFDVVRDKLSRTICAWGGFGNPCMGPDTEDEASNCLIGIVTQGIGSAALSWAKDVTDLTKTTWEYIVDGISRVSPVEGILLSCAPLALPNEQPAPAAPTPVDPIPSWAPAPETTMTPAPEPSPATESEQPTPSTPAPDSAPAEETVETPDTTPAEEPVEVPATPQTPDAPSTDEPIAPASAVGTVNGCNTYGENCDGNPLYVDVPALGYDWNTQPKVTTVPNGTTLTATCFRTGGETTNYAVDDPGPNPYGSDIYYLATDAAGHTGWIPDTYFVRDKIGRMGLQRC